jgi:hypothetical protein
MTETVNLVEFENDGIGWCSSCDLVHASARLDESGRPCCYLCGDYLIFEEDSPIPTWVSVTELPKEQP